MKILDWVFIVKFVKYNEFVLYDDDWYYIRVGKFFVFKKIDMIFIYFYILQIFNLICI